MFAGPKSLGRVLHEIAPRKESLFESEEPVVGYRVQLEGVTLAGMNPIVNGRKNNPTPLTFLSSRHAYQSEVIRLEHIINVNQPMKCREDPPLITGSFHESPPRSCPVPGVKVKRA